MAATVCQSPTAAALYVLPAGSVLEEQRSSSGARAAVAVAAGPLAHLTLLLLPPAAAAELLLWVDQLQLSQQQLQPLLEDMAVAVEACGIAAAGSAAAAQLPSNAALVWAQAAAAAGRVLSLAHTCPQLRLCEDMMAGCCQQLLVALRRTQPLAAGGLPSAEEASQLRLAAAAAVATGVDGSVSRSAAAEVSGPQPEEGMAKEGAKVALSGGGEALSAGKLDRSSARVMHGGLIPAGEASLLPAPAAASGAAGPVSTSYSPSEKNALQGPKPNERMAKGGGTKVPVNPADLEGASSAGKSLGESSTTLRHELGADPSSRVDPALGAAGMPSKMWLWWCCVLGSLIGWRDRELEAGYLAVRMQQWRGSRPSTWIAMGVIDIFTYGLMGVRAAYYAYSSLSAPHVVGILWYYLARYALVFIGYGLWLLLCPPSQWHLTGWVAFMVECVRVIGLEGFRCFNRGFEIYYLLARNATNSNASPIILACTMSVRIVLHQFPPPWLLLHAAAMVFWLWRLQVNIPGWWPSASANTKEAWLQPLVFAAAGIAAVVSQEAGSRAAYIKSLQRRQ